MTPTAPTSLLRRRPLRFSIKALWKITCAARMLLVLLFYKALPGLFFRRIGWGTRIYGRLRFGNVPSNVEVGRNCMLGADLFLCAGDDASLHIGDRCSINTGSHIVAVQSIEIGDDCMIAEYVSIRDQNHSFLDLNRPIQEQGFSVAPIKIGRNVWIGRAAFIGPGITIGDGVVVGANSVVTRSLPAFTVAAGAPARVIRTREDTRNTLG